MRRKNEEKDELKKSKIETDPIKIFLSGLENCKPLLKIVPAVKGGITYKCPVPMSDKDREFRGLKLLIATCLEKDKHRIFYDVLADELIDAHNNRVKRFFII